MKKSDEEKLTRGLRILFIKIPIIIWCVATTTLLFMHVRIGLLFGIVSLLILIPWCLFFDWFIK